MLKILGKRQWQTTVGQDPYNIDYDALSANKLVELAMIMANDPIKAPLWCNIFLGRLRDAIDLRKYKSAEYAQNTNDV